MFRTGEAKVATHAISAYCRGETCGFKTTFDDGGNISPNRRCGIAATHKIEETVFEDDPLPNRHPLTQYVCCHHFGRLMGRPCRSPE